MADINGTIIVSYSNDFKADLDAVCDALNGYDFWDASNSKFKTTNNKKGNRHIIFSQKNARVPSVSPTYPIASCDTDKAIYCTELPVEYTYEEISKYENFVNDNGVPTEELCALISTHIKHGSLQLSCISSDFVENAHWAQLRIDADGGGEFSSSTSHLDFDAQDFHKIVQSEATTAQ